ncbi:MAG: ComF family protein [Clostridiales bacterium]|nr:ComF family protein [Clostridiales bacterium]
MFLKSIKKSVYDIADSILKIIYPDKCIVCHKIISKSFDFGICEECIKDFCVFSEESCKKNFINDNGFSMFLYNDPIKKVIHKFKYKDCGYYAKVMGIKMGEFLLKRNLFSCDLIIPVPIHWRREQKRGFNQAEIMAKEISKTLGIPMYSDFLIRIKNTKPQFGLNKEGRIKNVEGAFEVIKPKKFLGKDVLIIDDIYTTGSTINECLKVIKNCGARNLYYFTLASTIDISEN